MAWNAPTLSDLISRVENDFSVKFFGTAAPLRRGVLKTLARVWAGAVYLLHLFLSWIYDQAFAHLANGDQLDRHGQEVGIYRKPATFAAGVVIFTGTNGTTIPQGTLLQSTEDTPVEYQTTEVGTISAGSATVQVTAMDPGAAGNLDASSALELVSPISGVSSVYTPEGISEGVEKEEDEPYRARILFKKRNPPQGGARADYVIWATSVSPVTEAWVFPNFPEANSVTIRVANYDADPPVLSASEVADVLEYVTDDTRRPVTADVQVASVTPSAIIVEAQIRPLTAQSQAAALVELRDLFQREGIPAATILRSQVQNAIAGATGMTGAAVTLINQDGSAVQDIALTFNQVATLQGATFTAIP